MPTTDELSKFYSVLGSISQYQNKDLITRPEWGKFNFMEIEDDINTAIQLADEFLNFPKKYITTTAINNLFNTCSQLSTQLGNINNFDITVHGSNHATYIQNLKTYVDQFVQQFHSWYLFAKVRNQDLQDELSQIKKLNSEASKLVGEFNSVLESTKQEADKTLDELKSAAAEAGVGQHTKQFHEEYNKIKKRAWGWFTATCGLALASVTISYLLFRNTNETLKNFESLQISIISIVAAKLSIVGILIAATLWSGRIYKSLVHLATINKHRSLSLQTFQTFVSAASQDRTRDYVLKAATNCIFSNVPTGFVDTRGKGSESTVQLTEINPFSQYSNEKNEG